MKMVKSLFLGSAAGLIAMSGAQAADLPVKAKAVEYVRICSLYGAGFFYIPGTDTCIKLGGYLRADVLFNTNSDDTGNVSGAAGAKNRFTNYMTTRARQDLNIDTRTATEYGVVRTYGDVTLSWTTDSYFNNGAVQGGTVYSPIGGSSAPYVTVPGGPFGYLGTNPALSPGSAPNNANAGAVAGGTLGVYYAFIQFAGFTMGKAISQFSAPWTAYPGNTMFDGLVGGGGTVTGVNQFSYTAEFGNGVSATISAQDPTAYYQAGNNNLSASATILTLPPGTATPGFAGAFGASDTGGTVAPDIVGMLRVDQAWGLFQLSGALHDNHTAYYGGPTLPAGLSGTEPAGHPDDKWGWAVQAALSIKNIPTGAGDTINVQAVYTDGATRYNIQDLASAYGAVAMAGGGSTGTAYQSIAFNAAPDTVFWTGSSQHTIKTWGMRGGYTHNWDPFWSSSVYGAYAAVMWDGESKDFLCANLSPFTRAAGTISCNPDYNIAQLGFVTRWTPVKNLTFAADFTWSHIDQKNEGTITAQTNSFTYPVGKPIRPVGYQFRDQDNYILGIRAQRNF